MANLLEEVEIIEGQDSRLLQITDKSAQTKIGTLSNLDTESNDNLVVALNEVLSVANTLGINVGDLSELDTTVKTSIVNAINEVIALIALQGVEFDAKIDDIEHIKLIDVTKHGAVADGVTDCTRAVQDLIETNANLYFPKGTYYFAQPITIDASNVHLFGNGVSTVLKFNGNGITVTLFRCVIEDLLITSQTNGAFGIKILGSYNTVKNVFIQDGYNVSMTALQVGEAGQGAWYNIFNEIYINDINNTARQGTGIKCYSSVNNVFSNIIIHGKNEAFWFDADKTVGYSTDGAQLENINVTTCNRGLYINDCSSIYIDNSIFDQITDYGMTITKGININITECYISAGGNSTVNYQAIQISDCEGVKINNSQIAGTPSTFGVITRESKAVSISACTFGHFTQAITFADALSENCDITDCYFNELVTTKLYLAGNKNFYSGLRGTGAITVAGGYQTTGCFYYATMTYSMSEASYSATVDIPLPTDLKQPIAPIVIPYDMDALYSVAYDLSNSPSGYVRIIVKRCDNTPFQTNVKLAYMLPFDFTA